MINQFLPVGSYILRGKCSEDKLVTEIQRINRSKCKVLIVTTNSMLKTKVYKTLFKKLHVSGIEFYVKLIKKMFLANYLWKTLMK
ncbi:hypothetical protein [Oceanobacillus sp. CF4.6]|uniref:hypothetical protein n=1 Tax=Oceanobacillus sp. CF4.6 TaxID=3373080 RepID=UPI003EE7C370